MQAHEGIIESRHSCDGEMDACGVLTGYDHDDDNS